MNNSIKLALVAAVAVAGIAACTSASEQNAAPTTAAPTTGTPTSETSTPPSIVTEVVTQTVTNPLQRQIVTKIDNRPGYGALKLGMTLEEARVADLTDLTWESPGDNACVADGKVAISKKYGVVRITLPADAETSKGVGVGSTFAEVKRAYPNASEYRAGWWAKVDDNFGYEFLGGAGLDHFADTDKVVRIKLVATGTDCALAIF